MTASNTGRNVMLLAWSFRRAEAARAFSDCLRGAWKMVKTSIKSAARFHARAAANGGRVSYGSLMKAPLHGFASGSNGHRRSGITTSRLAADRPPKPGRVPCLRNETPAPFRRRATVMTTATTTTEAAADTTEGDTRSNILAFPTARKRAYPNPKVKNADLPANAIYITDARIARQPPMTAELAAGLAYVAVRDLKEQVATLRNEITALQHGEG